MLEVIENKWPRETGAPKGTILELFSENLYQLCHSPKASLDFEEHKFDSRPPAAASPAQVISSLPGLCREAPSFLTFASQDAENKGALLLEIHFEANSCGKGLSVCPDRGSESPPSQRFERGCREG